MRFLHPWNFSGKRTGVGCHFLLQGIFPTQGSNLCLLHCKQTLVSPEPPGKLVHWRREWQSTPVLLPGKSHGQRSLVGYRPWGRKESDTTERFHFTFPFHALEKEMASHSSVPAWRIPGMAEPGRLPLFGVTQSRTRLK